MEHKVGLPGVDAAGLPHDKGETRREAVVTVVHGDRRRWRRFLWGAGLLAGLLSWEAAAEAQAAGLCDSQALQAALDQAAPGSAVTVGACTVQGPIVVPAGVTLRGLAPAVSRVEAPAGAVGVVLQAGVQPAALRRISVLSNGLAAVRAADSDAVDPSGSVELRHVRIRANTGIGIVLDGIGSASLRHVRLIGPVDPAQPTAIPWDSDAMSSATHGLVARGVGQVVLRHVSVERWVHVGVLAADSDLDWRFGLARHNTGAGLVQWAGSSTLRHLSLSRQLAGDRPDAAHRPVGAVFGGGATVSSRWLHVSRNEGWGLAHSGVALAEHERLLVRRNTAAGLWVVDSGYLQVDDALIDRNGYAGLVARDTQLVSMRRVVLSRSHTNVVPNVGSAGDGIQAFGTPLDLTNVAVLRNPRAGILSLVATSAPFDPQGALDATRVLAYGTGSALGAVYLREDGQQAALLPGVTRLGSVLQQDMAFVQLPNFLEPVLGGYRPNFLPQAEQVALYGVGVLFQQGGGGNGPPGDPFNPPPGN